MAISTAVEYAKCLAALEGNDFQDEVCTFLGTQVIGFQTIPTKPQGDGGLDGMSHNGEQGYCCYGMEHDDFKTPKARVNAIVDKFCEDLRRLFELNFEGKKLIQKKNEALGNILPKNCKLKNIYLVTNWFEDNTILGRIGTTVENYKSTSECRYLDAEANVVVIGPEQLVSLYSASESSLYRVQQRLFINRVKETAKTVFIENPSDFEAKMQVLREIKPEMITAIEGWSALLLENWRMALAFEIELDKTLTMLHQSLEDCRKQILVRVVELMMSSNEGWTQLGQAHDIALQILARDFGNSHGTILPSVSSGEIARLIGECPINWKKPEANA